jgi:hypothetical protein
MSKNVSKTAKSNRKRLTLELSQDAYTLLLDLAESTDKNMADVLRAGLALYGIAQEAKENGQNLGVVEKDRVVKEILVT